MNESTIKAVQKPSPAEDAMGLLISNIHRLSSIADQLQSALEPVMAPEQLAACGDSVANKEPAPSNGSLIDGIENQALRIRQVELQLGAIIARLATVPK